MYLERRLCHAVHAVPQYLSRRTRGTTTSAESVRYRLGQVPNQKTNNPPKYPLPPLHLAGPGTTGKNRDGPGAGQTRWTDSALCIRTVQDDEYSQQLSTPVHVRPRPPTRLHRASSNCPVLLCPIFHCSWPSLAFRCYLIPSARPLVHALQRRQPGKQLHALQCSTVQYSNVSLKPGVLLVTVTA
ncbi:hypothetical protein CCHR01_04484 [Colletotrichum chrysophilum]|uniref:Uncharacterized protein n=1 Tax=Colletotrichum chrysophilum TaxID=1836956 RepID=A0AAD9AW24_9PEZI|nr:hypothetical protein CCHR01_04484 [Colletotrichum chrysophilum]